MQRPPSQSFSSVHMLALLKVLCALIYIYNIYCSWCLRGYINLHPSAIFSRQPSSETHHATNLHNTKRFHTEGVKTNTLTPARLVRGTKSCGCTTIAVRAKMARQTLAEKCVASMPQERICTATEGQGCQNTECAQKHTIMEACNSVCVWTAYTMD